jgi:rsbT co-antagonist protein RsbR
MAEETKTTEHEVQGERVAEEWSQATEHLTIEEQLRDSKERFRGLIDGLQVGVSVHDGVTSETRLCNSMALDLLGLTAAQMVGKASFDPGWNVIHEDGSTFARESHPVPRSIATKGPVRDVVMGVYSPPRLDRVWILVSAMPQLTAEGGVKQVVCTFTDITAHRRSEELRRSQAEALAELSTPLIPISDDVVVMPLVGVLDTRRAQLVQITLLAGVAERRARIAILDITGVSFVDTQVANALIQAAKSVRLLGAQMVLTGIRPTVAQTLVGLGVDLSGIVTQGTLQSGITFALSAR